MSLETARCHLLRWRLRNVGVGDEAKSGFLTLGCSSEAGEPVSWRDIFGVDDLTKRGQNIVSFIPLRTCLALMFLLKWIKSSLVRFFRQHCDGGDPRKDLCNLTLVHSKLRPLLQRLNNNVSYSINEYFSPCSSS